MRGSDEEIYRKYRDDLIRYATTLVGPHQAEDVLSAVVLRILRRGGFGKLDDPRPYLFRAVLNESRSVLRRREAPHVVSEAEYDDLPDIDVVAAVMRLPVRQRAAIYLTYWEGMTTREVAHHMGIVAGTVMRYLFLARRHLRGVLQ